ncbi:hypothetical protein N7931_06295 [Catenovulum sp. 2E275]|uniref:hypothetical protein n=1 Tax=Catenovulum sp. 2E275 TaxID=2980497 RepID=UPI0021CEBD32|nr:hypothetical protein [Catenovulum sp. 2E275]MCU4675240.1 hypothetical protein [Catenovulum sp. 2E275]
MEIGSRGGHNVALERCSMFQDCMSKMNSVAFMMVQSLDKTPIKDIEVELPKYGKLPIPNPAAEVSISNFCSSLYASECGATGK